jgi:two-component system chemotaxis sensor kinase CheA
MTSKNDDFLKKLLAMFRIEANEHLEGMSSGILALERVTAGEQRTELVEKIFREAHSLKGAARAVNLTEIESVCHSLESVFAALKGKHLAVSAPLFDLLHQAIDALGGLLAADAGASAARRPGIMELRRRLDDALKDPLPDAEMPAPAQDLPPVVSPAATGEPAATADVRTPLPAPSLASETVRVSTAKLDAVMRQVEELLSPRLASGQRARELRDTAAVLATWKKERARIQPTLRLINRSIGRGDRINGTAGNQQQFPKLLEYLDDESLHMKTIEDSLASLAQSAEHDQRTLTGMTDNLLHDVKEMHLLPFSSLLEVFPRFTREFARDQAKEVELVIQGGEIEVDRRILEEMKDPLIHMLRNCIDHGIEKPAVREQKRKPPRGTITLAIAQRDSGKVEILVIDDGAGIDAAKVKYAARKLGIVSAEEADKLGEQEAIALTFRSGVSTSPIITEVSGRGLGLAIVREKVERLGGTITIESRHDGGTSLRILLPLTLATYRGILVRAGDQLFVIPVTAVERVMQMPDKDIRTVENRETIPLDGQTVSLVWLSDVLDLPRKNTTGESGVSAQAVILSLGTVRVAFRVEEILGEQEVLVKALGPQLVRVRNVAGASVLGTGQVVPVLNVPDLMKSAVKPMAPPLAPVAAGKSAATKKQSILVVEDSITSRALLKNILESAGYNITTAVDGIDAYTTLKTGTFDLIVSDVEMPRMDGFDLTAKVRADKQLAQMPVVLVTALESREHRERGIDVGANAYIVKSSFDQSNLLEVIRRLL